MKTYRWLLAMSLVVPLLLGAADKEARDVAVTQDQSGSIVTAPSERSMDATAQQVLRTHAMQTAVERMLNGTPTATEERTVPQHRRTRTNEHAVLSRMHQTRPKPKGLDAFRATRMIRPEPRRATQGAKLSLPTDITATVGYTLDFLINGEDTAAYVAGDSMTITISGMGSDTVWIELYMDDGDGIFDPALDLWMGMEDDDIFIYDGDPDDETPAGDGIWQVTFGTGEIGDDGPDPFFAVQGALIFIYGYTDSELEGLAQAEVLPPESTTSISGVITDSLGVEPAPNMIVAAFPSSAMMGEGGPEFGFLTSTDTLGEYVVSIPDSLAGMDYMVVAVDIWGLYPGLYPDPMWYEYLYISEGSQLGGIDFMMVPGNAFLQVTLTDMGGTGISGIGVYAWNGPYELWDTTGADGMVEFQVMAGWWGVEFDDDDLVGDYMIPHTGEWVEVFDYSLTELFFETYAIDAYIYGTATLPDDVTGVEGVEIHGGTYDYYTWAETGADGTYELPVSAELDTHEVVYEDGWIDTMYGYWVNAWMEGAFLIQPQSYGWVMAWDEGIDFTIYEADAGMSGFVYDADNMDPLRDAEIRAYTMPDTGMDYGMFDVWYWTDDDGFYELPMLGGYTWIVEVFYPYEWWYPSVIDTVYLYSGQYIGRDYYISPPVSEGFVEGYVYDNDGNPIRDAYVELYGPEYFETWTDERGYFAFHEVPLGWYTVAVWIADLPPLYQDIDVGPEPVYLEFWSGGFNVFVNGMVMDESEAPVPWALVYAWNWDSMDMFTTISDSMGYYELSLPTGWYNFRAGAAGFFALDSIGVLVDSDTIIDFMLTPAGAALNALVYGNVVGEMGYPVRNVFSLWETDNYLAYSFTNSDGYYEIPLVGDKDYWVMFHKWGLMDHHDDVYVPAGDTEYNLTLFPEAYMKILSVSDVGPDHGGKLAVEWGVHPAIRSEVKYFTVWQIGLPDNPEHGSMTDVSGIIPTHQMDVPYRKVVATETDFAQHHYVVIAYDHSDWPRWFSDVWSGFSTDDLAPMVPEGLLVSGSDTPGEVILSWEPSIDDPVAQTPVQHYTVYRAPSGGELAPLEQVTGTEFVDQLDAIGTYNYAVSATDFAGNESLTSAPEPFTFVSVVAGAEIPEVYALGDNYPNPFNPSSTIPYQLPEDGFVTLKVYDLTGKLVTTLVSDHKPAGYHNVLWNGKDSHGTSVATGVYFYRIEAGDAFVQTRKMILMK
jgi:hypothetical protein